MNTAEKRHRDGIPEDGVITAPRTIVTLEMIEGSEDYLTRHGCRVRVLGAQWEVTYPAGTHFQRIVPYLSGPIYWITLPDGAHLHEMYSSVTHLPMLSFPRHEWEALHGCDKGEEQE